MRRTRIKRKKDGTFKLKIDLTETDLKCLWHRTNQFASAFLETYDELSDRTAKLSEEEFIANDDYFIWNAIDNILKYEDIDSYDTNDEGSE